MTASFFSHIINDTLLCNDTMIQLFFLRFFLQIFSNNTDFVGSGFRISIYFLDIKAVIWSIVLMVGIFLTIIYCDILHYLLLSPLSFFGVNLGLTSSQTNPQTNTLPFISSYWLYMALIAFFYKVKATFLQSFQKKVNYLLVVAL